MNALDESPWLNIAYQVGWTLVHSLWQMAAVAIDAIVSRRESAESQSANVSPSLGGNQMTGWRP